MDQGFAKGVAITVIGGLLLAGIIYVISFFFSTSPSLRWGSYHDYEDELSEILNPLSDSHVAVVIENRGNAAAQEVEIRLERQPTSVQFSSAVDFRIDNRNGFFAIVVQNLSSKDTIRGAIFGVRNSDLEGVYFRGDRVTEWYIPQGEFYRRYASQIHPTLLIFLILYALVSAVIGLRQVLKDVFGSPGSSESETK